MRWGFRVATDRRFGAGHFARSQALASALGAELVLYCDPDHTIATSWPSPVVCEAAADRADAALSALRQHTIQALIFDSYAINDSVISDAVSEGFVAAFRDVSAHGPEAISINPNPGQTESDASLSGPKYMPLPAAFAERNENARSVAKTPADRLAVLIAFGAYDSSNRTMTAVKGLAKHTDRIRAVVALGPNAIHRVEVAAAAEKLPSVEVRGAIDDLAESYGTFDIAIGAPGVSQFERACCGLPSVLVAQSERQEPLVQAWGETGAVLPCGSDENAISRAVGEILNDRRKISQMRQRGLSLVDGKGAARLAETLTRKVAA